MLRKSTRPVDNFELRSWFFMRISGALIFVLVLVHLAFVHFINGVDRVNFQFVADRWKHPGWLLFDFAMGGLALLHGANGTRILIDDYIRPKGWRLILRTALSIVTLFVLVFGGIVMLRFRTQ